MADYTEGLSLKDPNPDTYIKWKIFKYPDENAAAGRTAFAMSSRNSESFIAGYTLLLTAIFMVAWDIILCAIILCCAPTKMNRSTYTTLVAIWNSGDPFSAGVKILAPLWSMFWTLIRRLIRGLSQRIRRFKFMAWIRVQILRRGSDHPQNSVQKQNHPNGQGPNEKQGSKATEAPNSNPASNPARNKKENDGGSWRALWFDFIILVLGFATFASNLALGIIFPNLLIIGNGAPVNPKSVLFPSFASFYSETPAVKAMLLQYESVGTLRALGGVEGAESSIRERVRYETKPWTDKRFREMNPILREAAIYNGSQDDDGTSEARYDIEYSYTVNGVEMGLQHLGPLEFSVSGMCKFEDTWYDRTITYNETRAERYDVWINAKDEYPGLDFETLRAYETGGFGISVSRWFAPFALLRHANFYSANGSYITTGRNWYEIIPSTAQRWSLSASRDPWYATRRNTENNPEWGSRDYVTKRGRPPLACTQNDTWSYGSWKNNTLGNLLREQGTNPKDWAPVEIPEAIKVILRDKFAFPLMVRLGLSYGAGTLKSAATTLQPENIIDAASSSAEKDIERMVLASYLASRDTFRDAGLAGSSDRLRVLDNMLFKDDGNPLPGTGDFILRSSQIKTMRLGWVIAFPTTFVILLFIAAVIKYGRRNWTFTEDQSKFRWVSQFIILTTGLDASHLYQAIDQILIEQEIQYKEEYNKYSSIPYVKEEDIETPLPVTEVQLHVNTPFGSPPQYRLTLGLRPTENSQSQVSTTQGSKPQDPIPQDRGSRYPWKMWNPAVHSPFPFTALTEQENVFFQGRLPEERDLEKGDMAEGSQGKNAVLTKRPTIETRPLSDQTLTSNDSIDFVGQKI